MLFLYLLFDKVFTLLVTSSIAPVPGIAFLILAGIFFLFEFLILIA